MPKRTHDDAGFTQNQDPELRAAVSKLKATFDNGVQQLAAQLKLARVFDRQKMSRRTKQAADDKTKLERLNAEIEVLKIMNEAKVARNYLLKQCVRTKRISESPAFQALFRNAEVKPPASTAESNVLGRLFKSGPVNEVLPTIMKGVRDATGADIPKEPDKHLISVTDVSVKTAPVIDRHIEPSDEVFEGFSDLSEGEDESASDDSQDSLAVYNARLADSDDEKDELKEHDAGLDPMEITDDEASVSEGSDMSFSDTSRDVSQKRQVKQPAIKATTSFLPSLMHGGYFSGSESEGDARDGYNPDKAYAEAQKPRKNRRGQQERRAIAEKKFGAKAKHLVKARGAGEVHGDRQKFIANSNQSAGWDSKRGAVEPRSRQGKGASGANSRPVQGNRFERRQEVRTTDGNTSMGKFSSSKTKPTQKDGGKLHPSWEAAKLRKSQSMAPEAFSGKKITFD